MRFSAGLGILLILARKQIFVITKSVHPTSNTDFRPIPIIICTYSQLYPQEYSE